jgi:hypothetical protein
MEVSGQHHAPATLSPRKKNPVAIEYEAGWAPEPVWAVWKKILCPQLDRPVCSLVTILVNDSH